MKIVKLFILFSLPVTLLAQSNFYYYKGEKIPLRVSNEKIYLKFLDGTTEEQKRNIIFSELSLKPNSLSRNTNNETSLVNVTEGTSEKELTETLIRLRKNNNVLAANSVYQNQRMQQALTEQFIVKLKSPADYFQLQQLAKEMKTEIVKQDDYTSSIYYLKADKNAKGNAMQMANYFYETNLFEFAEPDFVCLNIFNSNDPLFANQWGLKNTGQNFGTSGADIKVEQAWQITMGRPEIKVAVVDDGVDLNHPDLISNILPGYDATGSGTNGAPVGNDYHGTACAGIIAAKANNGIGIAGVAPNCKIIPVRVGTTPTESIISTAINWAWQTGHADVISNSYSCSYSSLIDQAINNAFVNGRNGLGTVFIVSSGNLHANNIAFPATNINAIAVGATTKTDVRAEYSSYGLALSVMAPGGNDDIMTTDISGSAGKTGDDYNSGFSGTSAACPFAAGTVALILSINPCLTATEARRILEMSCDKIPGTCYLPATNGTKSLYVGYGRVNAYTAVKYAYSNSVNPVFTPTPYEYSVTSNFKWILSDGVGNCYTPAAGTYIVKRHEMRADISFPYCKNPVIVSVTTNGGSAANPNDGSRYVYVQSLTNTSATLVTWVYEIISTMSGSSMSWFPVDNSSVNFNCSIIDAADNVDLYFQNEAVSGTFVSNTLASIYAGKNITNAIPIGNYTIQNGANVTFRAMNTIYLRDGFVVNNGATFRAMVDKFFKCWQYPYGRPSNENYPHVIKEYTTTEIDKNDSEEIIGNSIFNYPNPFVNITTIEYYIQKSDKVDITITDIFGRTIVKFNNNAPLETGKYQLKLEGIDLPAGTYFYKIETDNYSETKKMIKID